MKIATVVGARPQFIKASVVSRALRTQPDIREILIHTGQHYDDNMSTVFFRELNIPAPDYNLGVGSGHHGSQTGQMLEAIERVLLEVTPDWVLVYGDTNSTLAGALAAAKQHIPVAHVEAGLRSFNRAMPEEINRVLTDHASDMLFAPTPTAVKHLAQEGISAEKVVLTGDVMYDAALQYGRKAERTAKSLDHLNLCDRSYALATIHRPENTDDLVRLTVIVEALIEFGADVPVVLPLHPRTRYALEKARHLQELSRSVRLLEPISYLEMLMLERHARLIITDSGGVQKEAAFYAVPCVTLRSQTEWVESVELGYNRVVEPMRRADVTSAFRQALSCTPPAPDSLYGDGHSAERIAQLLYSHQEREVRQHLSSWYSAHH